MILSSNEFVNGDILNNEFVNGDILILANPGPPGKVDVKMERENFMPTASLL